MGKSKGMEDLDGKIARPRRKSLEDPGRNDVHHMGSSPRRGNGRNPSLISMIDRFFNLLDHFLGPFMSIFWHRLALWPDE